MLLIVLSQSLWFFNFKVKFLRKNIATLYLTFAFIALIGNYYSTLTLFGPNANEILTFFTVVLLNSTPMVVIIYQKKFSPKR